MLSRLAPSPRAFAAAKSRSVQPFSRSRTIAMATTKTVVYVKGDPVNKKLGDCKSRVWSYWAIGLKDRRAASVALR